MKINKVIWFTSGRGLVGIVHATQDDGEEGYYIAPCDGLNEVIDANMVGAHGAKFPEIAGRALFEPLDQISKSLSAAAANTRRNHGN